MLDDPHSDSVMIRETIAGIGQRPAELFPLLVDGPSKEVATERIAGHFNVSREMAAIVLDQQLWTLLAPDRGQ